MSWYAPLLAKAGSLAKDAVGSLWEDLEAYFKNGGKEVPPEIQQAKINAEMQIKLAEINTRDDMDKAYLADAANLRLQAREEVKSEDWFVRRARPAMMWCIVSIYAVNYGIMYSVCAVMGKTFPAMPTEVHTFAGVLFLGYGFLRSMDKKTAVNPAQ